jgi:ornithine--oxo-acid transaminase
MPPARAICERLLNEELFIKDTQHTTIRLAPTLVITEAELDLALERITRLLTAWDPDP